MAANAEARRRLEAEIESDQGRPGQAQRGPDRDRRSGARHRGPDPGPGAAAADPRRQRGGHPALPGEPARRHHRGLCRPAADGPPPAAGRAGAAGGYAGGGPRLDHARRRSAGTARRGRDPRHRPCRTRAPEGGHRDGPHDPQRRAGGPQPGAGAPGRPHGGAAEPNRRGRAQCGRRAAESRGPRPAGRHAQRVDRPHGGGDRRRPARGRGGPQGRRGTGSARPARNSPSWPSGIRPDWRRKSRSPRRAAFCRGPSAAI